MTMGLTPLIEIEMHSGGREYNEILKDISFIVSHKIRGPVATMLGLLGLIRMDALRQDELHQVYLHLEKCVNDFEIKCRELDELVCQPETATASCLYLALTADDLE